MRAPKGHSRLGDRTIVRRIDVIDIDTRACYNVVTCIFERRIKTKLFLLRVMVIAHLVLSTCAANRFFLNGSGHYVTGGIL